MPSPVAVNQTTICTVVSGYQLGEPLGQGECIFHGESFFSTFADRRSFHSG